MTSEEELIDITAKLKLAASEHLTSGEYLNGYLAALGHFKNYLLAGEIFDWENQ